MQPTKPHDAVDHRLIELEIKASFNEDLLDQLNQVVIREQQQLAMPALDNAQAASSAPRAAKARAGHEADLD